MKSKKQETKLPHEMMLMSRQRDKVFLLIYNYIYIYRELFGEGVTISSIERNKDQFSGTFKNQIKGT